MSFEEYKASLQEKKAAAVEVRPPNEGKTDPKWERMTAVKNVEEEFFAGKVRINIAGDEDYL